MPPPKAIFHKEKHSSDFPDALASRRPPEYFSLQNLIFLASAKRL
jgi:hypothetical protein